MLQRARRIAEQAGAIALAGWRSGVTIEKKGAIDLLTKYDLAAERCIREGLARAFPDHEVVGEEGEDQTTGERPIWYVDPIDGTTNFAHGHPFFCVSMALWAEGAVQVGVVVAPALGVTWTSARGQGAKRNAVTQAEVTEEACRVSTRARLEDALCATGFPYDRWTNPDDNLREHAAFLKRTRGIRRCGSAAIDLCLVAEGTYDIYWEQRLNPWDMCAGALMIEEAGGTLSDYEGGAADPRSGKLVATNGLLHAATLELLRETRSA